MVERLKKINVCGSAQHIQFKTLLGEICLSLDYIYEYSDFVVWSQPSIVMDK